MAKGKITKRSVDALQCRKNAADPFKRTPLRDDTLEGFGVAAFPSGTKVYVAQWRQNGRSRRITIGKHEALTPDQARREAE